METDHDLLQEIYKLTKDNNKMLHAMRRDAFLGGIIKVLVWAAFIIIPAWAYYVYLAPVMQQMITTMNAAQQGGAQAQLQLTQFQDMLKSLEGKIPGLGLPAAKP